MDPSALLPETGSPVERLETEIQRMQACLDHMRQVSIANRDGLSRIRDQINAVDHFRDDFETAVQTLPILGLYARIENSRPDMCSVGLESVASDVLRLASAIAPKFDALFVEASSLRSGSATLGKRILALTREPARDDAGLADASAGLARLREVWLSVEAVTAAASIASAGIVRDVSAVLTALQAHDVTRQRIEHVVEAIGELLARIGGAPALDAELAHAVASSLAIQVPQLRSAREQLGAALEEIRASLTEVASSVAGLRTQTRRIVGHGHDSPIAKVEVGVARTTATLRAHLATHRLAAEELDRITRATAAMGGHVDAIEGIGGDVKLVAINALIITGQLGDAGNAFSIVASEIQAVARSLSQDTREVTVALRAMAAAAEALQSTDPDNAAARFVEGEAVASGMDAVVAELRMFHAALERQLQRLADGSAQLERDVATIARSLDDEAAKAAHLCEVEQTLSRVEAFALGGARRDPQAVLPLPDTYTMEAERDIHRTAAGGLPAPPPAASGGGSELGANVELF